MDLMLFMVIFLWSEKDVLLEQKVKQLPGRKQIHTKLIKFMNYVDVVSQPLSPFVMAHMIELTLKEKKLHQHN